MTIARRDQMSIEITSYYNYMVRCVRRAFLVFGLQVGRGDLKSGTIYRNEAFIELVGGGGLKFTFKKPLSSNYGGDMEWDGVSELLVGGTIVNVEMDTNYCAFEIFNAGVKHLLELPSETNRLPKYGIGNEREWDKTENVIDAWVVTNELLLV